MLDSSFKDLTDFQAAEMLMKEENLTLGFDATTQEGVHVNSVHVTSQEECHVIDLDQLPVGKYLDLNFGYWRQEIMQYACL
jgi:hypothetical protein